MKNQFLKHGVVYGAANLVTSLGAILLVPVYTRALPPSEYGIVDYVLVVQTLAQICAGLEMTQGIARFYAGAGLEEDRRAYASTGLWFLVGSFAFVCLLLYLAPMAVGTRLLGLTDRTLFALALASIYARMLFYALQSQARWELRSDIYSAASLVAVTCSVALVAYLLLVRGSGLMGVFAGLAAGYGLGCAFCLVALRHTYQLRFDAVKFQQMLRFALPLTVSSVALFFATYGDRLILKSSLGFHDLGIYGVGARLAAVITVAMNGFQLGAAPLIYRHHGDPETPATLAQLMRVFLAAGLLGVVALAAFSIELLMVFATPAYAAAWRVIPIVAFAIVLANLYIFVPGLTIRHMTGRFAAINIVTAAVTLLLVAVGVEFLGVIGAAVGAGGGSAVGFALHAASSQRVYRMPIEWGRLGAGVAIAALAVAATWAAGSPGAMSLGIRSFVFAGASIALAAVLLTGQERASAQRALLTSAGIQ